jgi:hypothetical protein
MFCCLTNVSAYRFTRLSSRSLRKRERDYRLAINKDGKTCVRFSWVKFGFIAAIACILAIALNLGYTVIFGWQIFEQQAAASLQSSPIVAERIGEIASIELDFSRTAEEEGEDVFVFSLSGNKGTGVAVGAFVTVDPDTERLDSGNLELPSGETYDLITGQPIERR